MQFNLPLTANHTLASRIPMVPLFSNPIKPMPIYPSSDYQSQLIQLQIDNLLNSRDNITEEMKMQMLQAQIKAEQDLQMKNMRMTQLMPQMQLQQSQFQVLQQQQQQQVQVETPQMVPQQIYSDPDTVEYLNLQENSEQTATQQQSTVEFPVSEKLLKKGIEKSQKKRKDKFSTKMSSQTETKNIIKSIGNKLLSYLQHKFPNFKEIQEFHNITSKDHLVQLLQLRQDIQLESFHFLTTAAIPFIAQSKRLLNKKYTVKYIDSFIRAAIDPDNFKTFKPVESDNVLENKMTENVKKEEFFMKLEDNSI